MPMHEWRRVTPNRYHHFHQKWSMDLADAMNEGLLPPEFFAMAEQRTGAPEPDVVTLKLPNASFASEGGLALAEAPVKVRQVMKSDSLRYAEKANRIRIHPPTATWWQSSRSSPPGNKDSRHAVKYFVRKTVEFLRSGIHVLIVDLFRRRGSIRRACTN